MQSPFSAQNEAFQGEFEPITAIEEWAQLSGWSTGTLQNGGLLVGIPNRIFGQLNFYFTWIEEAAILMIECAYAHLVIAEHHHEILNDTIVRINVQSLLGHFNLNPETCSLGYSSTMILKVEGELFLDEVEQRVQDAVEMCEYSYPIFISVLYEKIPPCEAVARENGAVYGTA